MIIEFHTFICHCPSKLVNFQMIMCVHYCHTIKGEEFKMCQILLSALKNGVFIAWQGGGIIGRKSERERDGGG